MNRPALLLLLLVLTACARTVEDTTVVPPQAPPPECQEGWVYAPARYLLELAEGSEVLLDPRVYPFTVYCTKEQAQAALFARHGSGHDTRRTWALYKLEGSVRDCTHQEEGQLFLDRVTPLETWQSLEPLRK